MADKPKLEAISSLGPAVMRRYDMTKRLQLVMTPEESEKVASFDHEDEEQEQAFDDFIDKMAVKYGLVGSAH